MRSPDPVEPGEGDDEAAIQSGLSWLAAHAGSFAPLGDDGAFDAARIKPFIEMALLVMTLTRATTEGPHQYLAELVAVVRRVGASPDMRRRRVRTSADVLLRAVVCTVAARSGHPDEVLHLDVQRAVTAGLLDHAERPPHQVMEERFVLDRGGFVHDLPSWDHLVAGSLLAQRLQAVHLSERTAYHVTHDLMFRCALGGDEPESFEVDRHRLHEVLTDLLVCFLGESHWDLVGELLLCWDCLELPPDGCYSRSWASLLAAQASDGSLPGPVGDTVDVFEERYHTTLVLVLALNCRRRRARRSRQLRWTRTPPAPPTLPFVLRDVGRDARWLSGLVDTAGGEEAVVSARVLLGLWLCASMDPGLADQLPRAARRTAAAIARSDAVSQMPAALALSAHAILTACGSPAPGLSAYVERLRAVLSERPRSAADDLAWCEKRVILHQLGLSDRPDALPPEVLARIMAEVPRVPTADDIEHVLMAVGSAGGYGTDPTRAALESGGLTQHHPGTLALVQAWAVRQLRSSDLLAGCAMARCANALGPMDPERARSFGDAISMHQRPDGGYGRLSREVTAASLPGPGSTRGFDADLDVWLPTSLSALWALAELGSGFRLYTSFRASAPRRTPSPVSLGL